MEYQYPIFIPSRGVIESKVAQINTSIIYWDIEIEFHPIQFESISFKPLLIFNNITFLNSYESVFYVSSLKGLVNKHFQPKDSILVDCSAIYYTCSFQIESFDSQYILVEETYDNAIDIIFIQFGNLIDSKIETKLKFQIDFQSFFRHEPPFHKKWQNIETEINLPLSIKTSV
jgi:hypothetical protein